MTNDGMTGLRQVLRQHAAARDLRLHLIDRVEAAPSLLRQDLFARKWVVIADARTKSLAGEGVARALGARLLLVPPRSGGTVVAGTTEADALAGQLRAIGAEAAIAVGAGTLNDLTKIASHRTAIPCGVVATAPSMNGYTSASAALLSGGVKVSIPCAAPRVIVAPLDLLCQAPARMIAAGFGDLRSRPVSGADWYLGHIILGTPYTAEALHLIDEAHRVAAAGIDGLTLRTPAAVACLTAGLLLSGMAMDVAGTSAPASGAEHLVSHYLDMFHFARGGPHDLHGCQVGVATLAVARLYEYLLAADINAIEPPAHEPWEALGQRLESHFGPLWRAVEPVARQVYGDHDARQTRLETLRENWPRTRAALRAILGEDPASPQDLIRAGAPVRFADIGVAPSGARDALLHARFVRARYTVLDLAADLGVLRPWVDDLLVTGAL
jgi:glycerol-1-phosphate dehydrogenase [NAD(P)+]